MQGRSNQECPLPVKIVPSYKEKSPEKKIFLGESPKSWVGGREKTRVLCGVGKGGGRAQYHQDWDGQDGQGEQAWTR